MPVKRKGCIEEIRVGDELSRNGERKAALAHFAALRERYPDNARVWLHSAFLFDRLGREAEAIPHYERALELGLRGKDARDAYVCLASSLRNVDRQADGMAFVRQAMHRFPRDVVVELFYALLAIDLEETAAALPVICRGLLRESSDPDLERYRKTIGGKLSAVCRRRPG